MADAAAARDIAQKRQRLEREAQHRRSGRVKTLEDFMAERAEGGAATLRIIIKADQGGPAEALADALAQLSTPEVKVEVVHRRSEEHTSELQSRENLVCRLLLEKKKYKR